MARSFFDATEEASGAIPALTGARLKIKSVERTETGPNSQTPGCLMYQMDVTIVEPKKYSGLGVRNWFVIGTATDPKGEKEETWAEGSEKGPGKLKRTLNKASVGLSGDDEDWMDAAEGAEFIAPVTARLDAEGNIRNSFGKAYRDSDDDCPVIGEAAPKGKAKLTSVKKTKPVVEDEDEAPKAKATKTTKRPADDDDEDDE